jgi:hypothetical protein
VHRATGADSKQDNILTLDRIIIEVKEKSPSKVLAGQQWLIPIILLSWKAEIGRTKV